jgi:hypothetical protein
VIEYADRAALKDALGIETADDSRDALLDRALAAASRGIDTATGRRFWLDETPTARVYRTAGRTLWDDVGEVLNVDDIGTATGLVTSTGTPGAWTSVTDLETTPDNALARGRPITAAAGLRRLGHPAGAGHRPVGMACRTGRDHAGHPHSGRTPLPTQGLTRGRDRIGGVGCRPTVPPGPGRVGTDRALRSSRVRIRRRRGHVRCT